MDSFTEIYQFRIEMYQFMLNEQPRVTEVRKISLRGYEEPDSKGTLIPSQGHHRDIRYYTFCIIVYYMVKKYNYVTRKFIPGSGFVEVLSCSLMET